MCLSLRKKSSRRPRAAWSTSRRSNPPHGLSRLRRMSARTRGSWRSSYRSRFVSHRLGFIMANAGVDQSNVGPPDGSHRVLLLPENPDRSAASLRRGLAALTGIDIAVVINDSFGRPWRQGTAGVAIGAAGLPALIDLRGQPDLFGRRLEFTIIGFADEIAAAASLLMGQADEALPAVLIRGLRWSAPESTAASIVRSPNEDLFR